MVNKGKFIKLSGIIAIAILLIALAGQNVVSKQAMTTDTDTHTDIDKQRVIDIVEKIRTDKKNVENISLDNITKIDLSIGSNGSGKGMVGNVGAPNHIKIQYLKEPPKFTAEQIKRLEESRKSINLPGPLVPYTKEPVGPSGNGTSVKILNGIKEKNNISSIPSAPGDFRIFQNSATGQGGSNINEPSVATNGNTIFYTGNWYAARSTDGGNTFSYVSPFADMPTFCCDQDAIYDASRDIFIWYRQGSKQADGTNFFRLMISRDAENWWWWDFAPTDVNGAWTNQWWDYPQIALSNNLLIISSNMYDNSNACGPVGNKYDCWQRTVLMRMPLDQLSTGSGFNYGYIDWNANFNFGLTSGDTDVLYWGTHNSNSQFRIFSWAENSGTYYWYDKDIDAWTRINADASCPGPDGLNWCLRSLDKVTGGWAANGFVGFLWNAKQGSGFNYPYINSATFLINGIPPFIPPMFYWSRPYIFNNDHAWMYGNAYPDVRGDLGVSAFWGGGSYYPNHAVIIDDGYNGAPPPWEAVATNIGSAGADRVWGDYIRARPYIPSNQLWAATGYVKPTANSVDPRYIVFGREQDMVVSLRDALDYFSPSYLGTWATGGNALWYGQTYTSYNGGSAAQSDRMANNQEAWLQNTVNGPGTLSFTWTVSSEQNFDYLLFYIDGVLYDWISGTPAWQDRSFYIGPGSHTIKWRYAKDVSLSYNADAGFVDNVRFAPGSISTIYLSPNPMNYGGTSRVTVHVNDPDGNYISGASVSMSTTGGSFNPISGTADIYGNFVTMYTPPSTISTTNYNIHAVTTAAGFQSSSADKTITVRPSISIASAVDNSQLKWVTGGNKPWFGENTIYYHYGGDAAQSGPIINSQNSYTQTSVTGPGILSFWWAAESQYNHDFLRFYIDGVYKANRTGFAGWQGKTYSIGNGVHTLKWTYSKDGSGSTGYDAGWLDKVAYTSLVVTVPNGGETWKRGTSHTIKWNYTGNPGSYIKIELLKGGTFDRTISSNRSIGSSGKGSYVWSISPSQVARTDYKVKITSKSNSAYVDTSDKTFTISS